MLLVKVCKVLKVWRWHALARQVVGLADTCWCGRVVGLLHMPKDTAHQQTCAVYFAKVFGTSITAWAVIQTLNTLAGKSECQHVYICLRHGLLRLRCRSFQIHSSLQIHMRFGMRTGMLTTLAMSVKKSKQRCKHASVFLARVSMRRHMHAQMQGSMHNMYTCAYMQLQVWHWFLLNLV